MTELTPSQLQELRALYVRQTDGSTPIASLYRMASDWNLEYRDVARAYDQIASGKPSQEQPRPLPIKRLGLTASAEWQAQSPVANVQPTPGALTTLPPNMVLIKARMDKGLERRDVAYAVGISQTDYTKLESGQLLPTEEQAARIAALVEVSVANLFIAAADNAKVNLKTLSVLQLYRVRKRLNVRQLCDLVQLKTGVSVSIRLVGRVENGNVKNPSPAEVEQIAALADYLGVSRQAVMAQVPPALFNAAAQNTATLHAAIQEVVRSAGYTQSLLSVSTIQQLSEGVK